MCSVFLYFHIQKTHISNTLTNLLLYYTIQKQSKPKPNSNLHDNGKHTKFHKKRTLTYPRSIDVQDLQGTVHRLEVKVLGTEETWNTPSLMVATNPKTSGVAIFSQVQCV